MKKLVISLFLLLAACAETGSDRVAGPIKVSERTWGIYQEYLADIGINQPGAFAIHKDGDGAFYVWCREISCMPGTSYKREALKYCEKYGDDCVIFAFRREILIPYTLEKTAINLPTSQTVTPSVPDAPRTLRITKSLQAEIESYLANSATDSNTWRFLAINDAGDKIGVSVGCKKLKTGWGGWTAGGCGGEAEAQKRALESCGGDCTLIYDGARKIGSFDVVWF